MDEKVKPKTRRNGRPISYITKVLKANGPLPTNAIYAAVKERWPRTCPTVKQLNNLLAGQSEFVDTGTTLPLDTKLSSSNVGNGAYLVKIWRLKE
tara:strand:+ start:108 stop:392 length:285 start_codon:yes stop_codon:yes gene_type:complete